MTVASPTDRHAEAERLLLSLPRFLDAGAIAYRPGLERIRALLEVMDRPEKDYPIIHVAGTNGKGSVASFTASVLSSSGLKTGLHTSPHLLEIGERMRIDGVPVERDWLSDRVLAFRHEMKRIQPSFFEMTVALSLLLFSERKVDAAVVEVGLGGRLDATNAVLPLLSVITNVGLDHSDILGTTIEKVAAEKAGIVKEEVPVVVGVDAAAHAVIDSIASERSAPLENVRNTCRFTAHEDSMYATRGSVETPSNLYSDVRIGLPMEHQVWNAILATRSAERFADSLGYPLGRAAVSSGLDQVRMRSGLAGRFDALSDRPAVIADVAHNIDGIVSLIRHVKQHTEGGRLHVCIAMMVDKRTDGIGSLLAEAGAHVIAVTVNSPRALSPGHLAALLKQPDLEVDTMDTVGSAIDWFTSEAALEDVLLVTGSHLAVADALRRPRHRGTNP